MNFEKRLTQGNLREGLAQQFTAFDRSCDTLTHLAQQFTMSAFTMSAFTMSTFSGRLPETVAQQFTLSVFDKQ